MAACEQDMQAGKAIVFACNWCSYAAGDMAGTSRFQYPANSRVLRTMCSGRVDEKFILSAFELGAPLVLVSGCHFVDCHYIDANRATQRRVEKLWDRLERLGIRPERLQLEWMSAAEGQRFARVMAEIEEMRSKVTPEEIEETRRILAEKKKPAAKIPNPEMAGTMRCLRCGYEYRDPKPGSDETVELTCPKCRSNSVRRFR